MDYNFTQLNSLRYLYGEMTEDEESNHVDILLTDNVAFDDFEELDKVYQMLNSVKLKPAKGSIDKILEYSRMTAPDTKK